MQIWTEIAKRPSIWRYEALSHELGLCGLENRFEATLVGNEEDLFSVIELAEKKYSQLRIGSEFAELALEAFPSVPADLLNMKATDAFVMDLGTWWPRCFYYEGVMHTLVQDLKNLDLRGGVFIMGATWEARVLTAAFCRAGFNKITLSDVDESRAQQLVKQLARLNFGVDFQTVTKTMVTQLPGTNAIAVNVLSLVEHPELVSDLSYLNFLRPDGVWIETQPYKESSALTIEAISLGTQVEPALHLLSNVDAAWADHCFKIKIDLPRYRESLGTYLKNSK